MQRFFDNFLISSNHDHLPFWERTLIRLKINYSIFIYIYIFTRIKMLRRIWYTCIGYWSSLIDWLVCQRVKEQLIITEMENCVIASRVKQRVHARACTIGGICRSGSMILIWNSNEDDGKGLPVYAFPRSARRTSRNTERIKEKEKMYWTWERCKKAARGVRGRGGMLDTSVKRDDTRRVWNLFPR